MRRGRAPWPVLALVLLGHGAVLTLLTAAPPPPADGATADASPPVFQVRRLQAPPAMDAPPPPPAVAQAAQAPESPAAPAVQPAQAQAPVPTPSPPPSTASAQPAAEPSPAAPPPPDPPYFPRGELTASARPLASVDVPFPESVKGLVDLKVQVTLFIDEQGVVQRVRVDTPDVAPAFEQSVRNTFLQARFKPGEIDARPVRSQMRIEVEFNAASRRR